MGCEQRRAPASTNSLHSYQAVAWLNTNPRCFAASSPVSLVSAARCSARRCSASRQRDCSEGLNCSTCARANAQKQVGREASVSAKAAVALMEGLPAPPMQVYGGPAPARAAPVALHTCATTGSSDSASPVSYSLMTTFLKYSMSTGGGGGGCTSDRAGEREKARQKRKTATGWGEEEDAGREQQVKQGAVRPVQAAPAHPACRAAAGARSPAPAPAPSP